MQVILAGYNVDRSVFATKDKEEIITPETISAAYARISRSKKSVTQLRKQALLEVEKARKSNDKIIFEMGHSSIAEHAVFNLDIIGVSRYLVEFIEKTRLASFTEKSQRYVTLKGDYYLPSEIAGTNLEAEFQQLISLQNETYKQLYEQAREYLQKTGFDGSKRELEGKAKEDARYVLSLATQTQLGMTINARSLEKMLCRLDSLHLQEATELKKQIESEIKGIAPSLIKYTNASEYEKELNKRIPAVKVAKKIPQLQLIDYDEDGEDKILAALLFQKNGGSISELLEQVKEFSSTEKDEFFSKIFADMCSFHSVPRAFETAYITFQFSVSSSCFGQLKRHRMSTIIKSQYTPQTGYVVPPLLVQIGAEKQLQPLMTKVENMFMKLEDHKEGLGSYILTNAHRINVFFHANLRELYHFSRLRSDKHAQWEIRELSLQIDALLKKIYPHAAKQMMGKDCFGR